MNQDLQDEFENITPEKIKMWAEEISTYQVGMPVTLDKWRKIQIVATYVFNHNNHKN